MVRNAIIMCELERRSKRRTEVDKMYRMNEEGRTEVREGKSKREQRKDKEQKKDTNKYEEEFSRGTRSVIGEKKENEWCAAFKLLQREQQE
ncbi:hypothetical protein PRIPAC_76072 [Pristionchus pacificus]|uniref:Uncharacterized protein n=1 Tax=Pristionchus pacificus TaxID=54126 RepID=A0A2A6C9U4_PRIPA|nr:hypothetical protein PRIPAC_76072 [Pristionchus pacificus]|eukprot:PDM74919.1 hypothetical protein PRIPAC_40300 [Pristionchus pacificus]